MATTVRRPALEQPAGLSDEDHARSGDRSRVWTARREGRRLTLAWLLIGPGILAMLGENDGPSMLSYATTGSTYGVGFFVPFIAVTFGMAIVCQEMAMRVGAVTHRGYGKLVLERFGPAWGWFGAVDLGVTNLITLIAEFVAIRIGLSYFGVGAWAAAGLGMLLVLLSLTGGRYWRWERIALGLAAFNGLFLLAAIQSKPDVHAIGHAFASFSPFPGGSLNTLLLLLASTIGATVTPWMIFFQQSASADKGMTPDDIGHGRLDTALGGVLAAAFGIGALLACATLSGHPSLLHGADFPSALKLAPGGGSLLATLFAIGLVEAGAVAVLTISASTAYAFGECVGARHSFNSTPRQAALFHGSNFGVALVAALITLIPGAPLLAIALNANVLATVLLPVALIFLLLLANDRELMGPWANRRSTNVLAGAIIALVGLSGAAYGIDSFLTSAHVI
ncbi:MAG: NRAMP family divalent metal transporter [Solirubrobacteraceae bacterium]